MDSFTIKQKLIIAFNILIILFVLDGIFSERTLNHVNQTSTAIATKHVQSVIDASQVAESMIEYRKDEFAMVTGASFPYKIYSSQQANRLRDQIDIMLDQLEPSLSGHIVEQFQKLKAIWSKYKTNSDQLVQLAKANRTAEAVQLLETSDAEYHQIDILLQIIVENRKDFINQQNHAAYHEYQNARILLIVSIIFVVLFSTYIGRKISLSIINPINNLKDVSKKIAGGDLSLHLKAEHPDELGELTETYGKTIDKLRGLITEIQKTAENVSSFSEQLTANARQSSDTTQQIANSIGNVADIAGKQETAVDNSLNSIKDMETMLKTFEERADTSSKAAQSVEQIANDGKATIQSVVEQMSLISDSVSHASGVIKKLAERSDEIGQISDTISGISAQTNLLALNAAIEAARAGEHGRGFAVVADEVRKLAEGAGEAASKIAQLIENIQAETENAVQQTSQGMTVVETGKKVVADAGAAFDNISDAVNDLARQAADILEGAKRSSKQVAKLVTLMESLDEIGREVSAETQSVSAATEEQSAAIDEVAHASGKLSNLAQDLSNSADKFKI